MKKIFLVLIPVLLLSLLSACAGLFATPKDPNYFDNKTGVLGVFRIPSNPCSGYEGPYGGSITLGKKRISARNSDERGDIFFYDNSLAPGEYKFHKFEYSCKVGTRKKCSEGECYDEPIFKQHSLIPEGRLAVKIPSGGFCKTIISFKGRTIVSGEDDDFLLDFFNENEVAVEFEDIPYCKVTQSKTLGQ